LQRSGCGLTTTTAQIWPWADSPLSSDWPWLRNISTSVTLAKGEDYRRVRVAFALDCYDREVMSFIATTKGIDAGLAGDLMQAVKNRFGTKAAPTKPIEWLTGNGSCYTAAEKRSFAKLLGLKPLATPVTSPLAMAWKRAL
jgi:transposase InsO family protein